jgi:hypothetical protein
MTTVERCRHCPTILRYRVSALARDEMPPLTATAYDGRGIVRTPDGR